MKFSDEPDRCELSKLHQAYVRSDLEAILEIIGQTEGFPNCAGPLGVGGIPLEYAIYHSPFAFIRRLLDMGANPNYPNHAGFPSLMAALQSDRPDRYEIVAMLLARGANVHERGLNGWTALHYAVVMRRKAEMELLLRNGADPRIRTNVDEYETAIEIAEAANLPEYVEILERYERE